MSRFLSHFRPLFAKTTDAPYSYGEATGLAILSTIALGRRTLDYGQDGIKPNLFMMLVGESSVSRKSTCVNLASSFIEQVDDQRIGPRDYTVEGLLRWMREKDPATNKGRSKVGLFAEEFGGDLARMEAYGTTTAADFCALYDGKSFTKVRSAAAPIQIDKPRITLFAACAYPMLERYLRPRDWFSGYLMRFLYVMPLGVRPKTTTAPPFPRAEFTMATAALKILRDDLSSKYMQLQLDSNAKQVFDQYVMGLQVPQGTLSHITHTYMSRYSVNLLKLALLYQLDIDPFSHITAQAVHSAASFAINVCWPSFEETYKRTALGDFNGLYMAIVDRLISGPLSRQDLGKTFFANEFLDRVVAHMKNNRVVRTFSGPSGEMLQLN